MKQHRDAIAALGHTVTSRWLDEKDGTDLQIAAIIDIDDLRSSDAVIVFTEDSSVGYTTGGRHVELGFALAIHKPICIVGPRENVFCHMNQIVFAESVNEAVNQLVKQF